MSRSAGKTTPDALPARPSASKSTPDPPPARPSASKTTPDPPPARFSASKTAPDPPSARSSTSVGTAPNVHLAYPRSLRLDATPRSRLGRPTNLRSISSSRRPRPSTAPFRSAISKRMCRCAGSTRRSRAGDQASRGTDTPRVRSRNRASASCNEPSPAPAPAMNSRATPASGITARRRLFGRARSSASTLSSSIPGTSHSNRPGSRSTSTSSGIVTVSPSSSSPGANR